jgi:murein DD-endopeptidase MepM/ murein hydrolase activator NlpD
MHLRKKRILRRRIAILSIFSLAVTAIFLFFAGSEGPAPANNGITLKPVTGPAQLTHQAHGQNESVKIVNKVRRGDNIINLLMREGLNRPTAYEFFTGIKAVYDLKRISAGKPYTLFLSKDKQRIHRFIYEIDADYYLEAAPNRKDGGYDAKLVTIPYHTKREYITGKIMESLFTSILKSGEKPELADMMASLFEYDVDFNRDIRKNDNFALLVEKMYLKGKFVRYGNILAAEFINRGQAIQVVRYTDPDGHTAYYHPDGRSVRKMFLRCPLPFMRVTSRYGNRRHPLLGFSAKHNGIDLSAPRGTKVRTTASGIIKSVGYSSSKGRFIAIRHNNRYVSHYYHLSRVHRGIRRGTRVVQGQLIGYVGNTGWSTGPHLHYGLQKNGRFMNPLALRSPSKDPVKKAYVKAFKQHTARVLLLLSGSRLTPIPDVWTNSVIGPPGNQNAGRPRTIL